MRNPVVLHVVRPYPDENSFLAAEAWTIDVLGMVLIDQRALEPETPVVFDVALANGTKVIRAEARAEHAVPPSPGRPGGLRVRFRRYGSQTKAFIDRAVAFERSGEPPSSRRFGGAPAAASALAPAATPSVRPVSRPPPLPITRSQPPPLPVRSGSQRPPPLPARDAAGPSSLPPSPPPIGERARSVRPASAPAPPSRRPGAFPAPGSTPPPAPSRPAPAERRSVTPPPRSEARPTSRPPAPATSASEPPSSLRDDSARQNGVESLSAKEALPTVEQSADVAPSPARASTNAEADPQGSPRESPPRAPVSEPVSGVHALPPEGMLPVPPNRDELLARLRERARRLLRQNEDESTEGESSERVG